MNEGRLSLVSGNPVPTGDVVGASTVYFMPYSGGSIQLYDSVSRTVVTVGVGNPSVSLSGLTSGLPYDLFVYLDTSTDAPLFEAPYPWADANDRQSDLQYDNGILVKTVSGVPDPTRRYVGTFIATGSSTTEDSAAKRFLFNVDNRVKRPLSRRESANSWTVNTTGAWQQANGNSANKVEVCIGFQGSIVDISLIGLAYRSSGDIGPAGGIGIGEDTTTAVDSNCTTAYLGLFINGQITPAECRLTKSPATIGHHSYNWLEASNGFAITMFGTKPASSTAVQIASGLQGYVDA